MDPEPDLDAIAQDLAAVEAELDRLAEGTFGDAGENGEDEGPTPGPAGP